MFKFKKIFKNPKKMVPKPQKILSNRWIVLNIFLKLLFFRQKIQKKIAFVHSEKFYFELASTNK